MSETMIILEGAISSAVLRLRGGADGLPDLAAIGHPGSSPLVTRVAPTSLRRRGRLT